MAGELTERQRQLKEQFIRDRGYWSENIWDPILKTDPDFFEAYLNFSAHPWKRGVLPIKVKQLIYVALEAATTTLYEPALRQHVANALKFGATREEIMEVLEMVSVLGIHTCTTGVPILLEELKKAGE